MIKSFHFFVESHILHEISVGVVRRVKIGHTSAGQSKGTQN